MRRPGDVVIIPTVPPHIGCVVSESDAICEDGVIRPYPADAAVAVYADEFLRQLESEVLRQNDAR